MTATKLSKTNSNTLAIPGVQLSATSLTFTHTPTESDWTQTGVALEYVAGATMFWLGDWANYAQTTWGEKYTTLIEQTGYDYSTLRDDVWVCNAVDMSRRRDKLSFAHHREVAKLEATEQAHWLAIAEREGLTRNELRASIKAGEIVRAEDIETSQQRTGFDSIERLPLDFNRIYRAAWHNGSITDCADVKRLQTWIAATEPMATAYAKAKARLAELTPNAL